MPLPTISMSIQDFCLHAKTLLRDEKHTEFVFMMLTGVFDGHQVVIDAIIDSVDSYEVITGTRDFDSVIGIAKNIRIASPLTVHPVPKHDDTLTRDIHLKYRYTTSEGTLYLPVHKVPNLCVAKYDTHHKLLVQLPELYSDDRKAHLTQDEMKTFYECGLRPAIVSLSPDTASEWPATYSDEMFRARGQNGQLSFCTKIVAQWLVPELGDAIRLSLAENGSFIIPHAQF
ncbi:hypothetical protein BDZ94DRAFT_1316104 [Collybia nuda]|uniref:Uncharacterized protein n=1 Tax=Collybia nuda TaxID=64659 RepID=A0A9P5XRS8_9AGAR|nr:hypothetical protein BDZ94DRAFT_1316104 [Collybia nuda]